MCKRVLLLAALLHASFQKINFKNKELKHFPFKRANFMLQLCLISNYFKVENANLREIIY